jgi:hypothetical protein
MMPAIYELDLEDSCEALTPADRGGVGRLWAAATSPRYRAARARLRSAVLRGRKLSDRELCSSAVAGRDSARTWSTFGGRGIPNTPRTLTDCQASRRHLLDLLDQLEAWPGQPPMAEMRTEDCEHLLNKLDADRGTLVRLPEPHRLRTSLRPPTPAVAPSHGSHRDRQPGQIRKFSGHAGVPPGTPKSSAKPFDTATWNGAPDPTSRRGTLVCFTERGWDEANACAKILDQLDEELTKRMGADRLEQLQALLAEAIAASGPREHRNLQEPQHRDAPGEEYLGGQLRDGRPPYPDRHRAARLSHKTPARLLHRHDHHRVRDGTAWLAQACGQSVQLKHRRH